MAGEKKGKTYEAIIRIVLEEIREEGGFKDRIFWNQSPDGVLIEPDFVIGPDVNNPRIVISVTHFTSPKESNRKAWRNIGEICEIKRVIVPRPATISVVFDALLKEDMKRIQEIVFGSQLIVGDRPYGRQIIQWVAHHINSLPSEQNEKYKALYELLRKDTEFAEMMTLLKHDLCHCLNTEDSELSQLWDISCSCEKPTPPNAKDTYFRRGIAKRLLVGDLLSNNGEVYDEKSSWLVDLGLVKKTISTRKTKYRVIDEQLKWFISTAYNNDYKEISSLCSTEGFFDQMEKVKSLARLNAYNQYVISHYMDLTTTKGMEELLDQQNKEPSEGLDLTEDITPPKNIWIYDYISALSKAAAGKSQAFGYSSFASHPEANAFYVGTMSVGEWCSCFINQYFNRLQGFSLSNEVKHYVAQVLSEELNNYSTDKIADLSERIKEEYIAKEYEATYLSHRGFEPLLALLYFSKVAESSENKRTIQTCFAERAGLSRNSGTVTVIQVNHTIILWKSSYDGHPADKQKEVAGLATGIRYTWDSITRSFTKRPGIEKMILLLDGNWKQHHLSFLLNAGWDEIYYPDEINELKAAIV